MNFKTFFCSMLAVGIAASANAQSEKPVEQPDTAFHFTDVKTAKTTSVKDQNKSGTCWCFAGTSFFEEEIMRRGGDSLDLSEMYTVRQCYLDKARKYVRMDGEINFAQGGAAHDVPYVWEMYGAVPEEVYRGANYGEEKPVHGELSGVLKAYLDIIVKRPDKKLSTAWEKGFEGILDAYFGEMPETFTYKGKTYTPQSFAKELGIDPDNYVAVTSFTHHPFYKPFVLEVSDNWLWAPYVNVPMEDMKAIVDNALANGYTVAWAADVSEGGFKWKEGFAVMPADKDEADLEGTELSRWVKLSDAEKNREKYDVKGPVKEIEVTQEMRQDMFDRQETTDDHGMVIVGKATDQNGNEYYKVQNSWTDKQKYGGYFYVSMPYFLAKTMDIYVNKEAVPAAIRKRTGI